MYTSSAIIFVNALLRAIQLSTLKFILFSRWSLKRTCCRIKDCVPIGNSSEMAAMLLKEVCIEVRRKLQCANVYLTFDKNFSECQSAVKIILKSNEITIKYDGQTAVISLLTFFSIDQRSISSLVIEGNNVSFRVILANETGSLDLLFDDDEPEEYKIINAPKDDIKVTMKKDQLYQLKCSNCENTLLDGRKCFSRVLELPSEFIGMSEWFCHKHDHVEHDLTPKVNDVFFGLYFIVINFTNICNVIDRDQFIYCKRCLKFLGEKVYRDKAVKIWNDSTCLDDNGTSQQLFAGNDAECIHNIINKILTENLLTSKLYSMQFVKILFEATFPNRKRNFLMLNILERNLEILANFHVNNGEEISLESKKSLKVLFKAENSADQPLVTFWKNDFNVQNVTVSHKMFTEFVRLLQSNAKLVPEIYRYNNGFMLSYFFLQSCEQ